GFIRSAIIRNCPWSRPSLLHQGIFQQLLGAFFSTENRHQLRIRLLLAPIRLSRSVICHQQSVKLRMLKICLVVPPAQAQTPQAPAKVANRYPV
ncbi:hypothetical protein Y032_0183g905, partial [Ancylostoma ceylanicum]